MNYCTLDDVQALISWTISANSNVTADTVNNVIIPQTGRYIDDRLGKFYVTPITGENALLTINRVAKYLVAAEIAEITYIGQSPSDSPQSSTWRKLAEADLQRIADGGIILTDAVPTGDTPEKMSQQISDKLSQPTRLTPPAFSMGKVF